MLTYQADKPEIKPIPNPAKAAKDPKEIASMEQLFLTGLHLEQYRHATYNPMVIIRKLCGVNREMYGVIMPSGCC